MCFESVFRRASMSLTTVATIPGAQGFPVQLINGLMRTKDRTTSVPLALEQFTTEGQPFHLPRVGNAGGELGSYFRE